MENNTVSIIVPVYNAAQHIEKCLNSLLAQTYNDFKIILIDDGSKDHSGEICDYYAKIDGRIEVIHKENKGVSHARNVGLDLVDSKYVTFCDSDDTVDSHWLQTFMDHIGNADVCVQGFNCIRSDETIERRCIHYERGGDIPLMISKLMDKCMLGFQWCKMYRFEVIKQNGIRFDESLHLREDDLFMIDCACYLSSYVITDECHYNYIYPDDDKKYKSGHWEATHKMLHSILRLCGGFPHSLICRHLIRPIKSNVVMTLSKGGRLSPEMLNLYGLFVDRNDIGSSIKSRIVDKIIVNSRLLGGFANFIITAIHKANRS